MISIDKFKKCQNAFAHTFEWYVSELIKWKFKAFGSSYGIEISNIRSSDQKKIGDYDVLAVLGNLSLLYIECKTGSISANHIEKVIERSQAIHCLASIVFFGKSDEENIRDSLRKIPNRERFGLIDQEKFYKLGDKAIESGEVYRWNDCYFVTSKTESVNVEAKVRTTLRLISANDPRNYRTTRPNYKHGKFSCNEITI